MSTLKEILENYQRDVSNAEAHLIAGRVDDAAVILNQYKDTFSRDFHLLALRGRLAYMSCQYEEAVQLFDQVPEFHADHDMAAAFKSVSLFTLGRKQEALSLIEGYVDRFPEKDFFLQHFLRMALTERGLEAALAKLEKVAALRPPGKSPIRPIEMLRQKALSLYEMSQIIASDKNNILGLATPVESGGYNLRAICEHFEAVGRDCEFGFVQRHYGAEPLSLFRWTSIEPPNLVRLLNCKLDGYDNPAIYSLRGNPNQEFLLHESLFGTESHTGVNAADLSPEEFLQRVVRRQGFLIRKFISDLSAGTKTFLYKAGGSIDDATVRDIAAALFTAGAKSVLIVSVDAAKTGKVESVNDRLAMGYISDVMPNTQISDWAKVLTACYDLFKR